MSNYRVTTNNTNIVAAKGFTRVADAIRVARVKLDRGATQVDIQAKGSEGWFSLQRTSWSSPEAG